MNLAPLLRQTVPWAKATGQNDRGEWAWAAPVTVPGRAVSKMKEVLKKTGDTITTQRQVTMLTEPAVGDQLEGREVVQVAALVDYTGTTVGYAALTR